MYSMLVVDDEPIIADGLFELLKDFDGQELDIYKAYSGHEAFEIMMKTKIDIVMTDICMPNITGIDMQNKIRHQWPRCKVIFLMGFDEFDYRQTAIRNDGADYILKTEGDEVILKAVRKAVSDIEKELKDEQLVEKARKNMGMALPFLQKKYLLDIVEGKEWCYENMDRQFKELEIPLDSRYPVLLMIGRVDIWSPDTGITEKMKIGYGIKNIAEEYLSKSANIISLEYDQTRVLWVMQPLRRDEGCDGEDVWESLVTFVRGTVESIQRSCRQLYDVPASFVVSSAQCVWEDTAKQFDLLKLTMNMSSGFSSEALVIAHKAQNVLADCKKSVEEDQEYLIRSQLKKMSSLEAFLESGQKDEFIELYSNIMDTVRKCNNVSYDLIKEVYYSISTLFLSYLNRWKMIDKSTCIVDLDRLMKIEVHSSMGEIIVYFSKFSEWIFERKKEDYDQNTNRIIAFIKNYTEQHLDGDISLTKLADLLHFNPSYLSRLYKKVTGKSLSEYISEVKICRAREMLKQNELKINEIASALGFETASYFTRYFKKCTNLNPQDYRETLKE